MRIDEERRGQPLTGGAARRPAQEHCAAHFAQSTDLLRRIDVWKGRVTLSYVCPYRHRLPCEDCISWVSSRHGKNSAICGAWRAAASATGRTRTEAIHDSADASTLLAKDSFVDTLCEGLQDESGVERHERGGEEILE